MALLGRVSGSPAHACRGSSVVCAAPALFSMGDRTWKTDRTSWSEAKVMEYVDVEPMGHHAASRCMSQLCIRSHDGGALPCGIS